MELSHILSGKHAAVGVAHLCNYTPLIKPLEAISDIETFIKSS